MQCPTWWDSVNSSRNSAANPSRGLCSKIPGLRVVSNEGYPYDWKKGRDRQKGVGMRVFINTAQDIDALAAEVKAAGVALDQEPHDTPWRSRAFEVTEPSRFKLTIAREP